MTLLSRLSVSRQSCRRYVVTCGDTCGRSIQVWVLYINGQQRVDLTEANTFLFVSYQALRVKCSKLYYIIYYELLG